MANNCNSTQVSVCGNSQTATCDSAQTFCNANHQTVQTFSSLKLSNTVAPSDFITANLWNIIKIKLEDITNLGALGTKNNNILPYSNGRVTSNVFSIKTSNQDYIPLDEYNNLLSKLNKDLLQYASITYASTWNNLIGYINNYTLNNDRCDVCNAGCQLACELASQCHCDGGGGGCGDCGTCYAGGQGCGGVKPGGCHCIAYEG